MNSVSDIGLEATDRAVSRAVAASAAFRKSLADDPPGAVGSLAGHRPVSGQQALTALRERGGVSQDAEWRDALCRWIAVLAVRRVSEQAEIDLAQVEAERTARVHLEVDRMVAFREAWRELVTTASPRDAAAWLTAAADRGQVVASARQEVRARRHEALVRLGYASWAQLTGESDAVASSAADFLRATDDLAAEVRREATRAERPAAGTFVGAVLEAIARDAPDGFSARLTLHTIMDMFGGSEGSRGLRLDVPLPRVLGAASFARALVSFGAAFRRAGAASGKTPFALASDATFVDAHRFGFVFGALVTDPVFHRKGLGVVARVADKQARIVAKTALLHARTLALQALMSREDTRPDRALFEELTHRVYGHALPATLLGAFPRARFEDEAARAEALFSSLAMLRDLRERFDEDWFKNPRAWRSLRARASGPARIPAEPLDAASLARAFEESLG